MGPGQAVPSATLAQSGAPNPGGQVSDPMSALRSLAGQGTGGTITIQSQPGQTQMTASLLGSGGTISTMPTAAQPPPQVQVQSLGQGGMPPSSGSNVVTSLPQQNMNPLVMQQTRFLGSVGGIVASQPSLQQSRPQMLAPNVQIIQKYRQQAAQGSNVTNTSMPLQGGFNENLFMQSQQPSPVSAQFQGHSPAPVTVPSQGPSSNQSTIPSPVSQHPSGVSSQMAQSPAGYAPSPTSQITPSPASSFPGRTPAGAPSPGSALNTPVASGATPSPVNRASQEDLYLEKRKQLSKYIEPLKRMIAKIDKDENKKKDCSKFKNLLDILNDPNRRCAMDVLLKCEQVLEKMVNPAFLQMENASSSQLSTVPKTQEQNICQPLLEALSSHVKSPLFNHTLQRTFGPAISALLGPSYRIPSPPPKKKKIEEDVAEISDVLQGEIARLDQRFKVQLEPAQHAGSRTVHLICQLDDKNLPCVPPISITVPENYPDKPPECNTSKDEYESTPFLQRIQQALFSRLSCMPQKYSITSLLDTWEMSVRQACSPQAAVAVVAAN